MTKYLKKLLFWIFIIAMIILMGFLGMHAFIDGNGSRAVSYLVEKYELEVNDLNVTEFQEYVYEDIVNCDSLWLRKCTSDENLAYIIGIETKDGDKITVKEYKDGNVEDDYTKGTIRKEYLEKLDRFNKGKENTESN